MLLPSHSRETFLKRAASHDADELPAHREKCCKMSKCRKHGQWLQSHAKPRVVGYLSVDYLLYIFTFGISIIHELGNLIDQPDESVKCSIDGSSTLCRSTELTSWECGSAQDCSGLCWSCDVCLNGQGMPKASEGFGQISNSCQTWKDAVGHSRS